MQGHAYHLALSVPLTYQPAKGYGLVVCLHGAGFTGEAYLERWQARLGEDYVLACPTAPMGAWFTRERGGAGAGDDSFRATALPH